MYAIPLFVGLMFAIIAAFICYGMWPDSNYYFNNIDRIRAEARRVQALYILGGGLSFGALMALLAPVVYKLEQIAELLKGQPEKEEPPKA